MTFDASVPESSALSPDEAFSVVGNDTRLQIMEALGRADGPLSYSDLFDRIDYEDSANFTYHLERLTGHFVHKSSDGYRLRRAGTRIVEAILSGTVTEYPVVERTPVETPCFVCGGRMEASYRHSTVLLFCADCGGTRDGPRAPTEEDDDPWDDIVGGVFLPPAGVHWREPSELLHAAEVLTVSDGQAVARDVCPRCAAPLDHSVAVCRDHDASRGRCESCDRQFAATVRVGCRNCIFQQESIFTARLLSNTDLMAFMIDHGIDPIRPEGFHLDPARERVESVDPFRATFTFVADGDAISLTVDGEPSVVDVRRHPAAEIGG